MPVHSNELGKRMTHQPSRLVSSLHLPASTTTYESKSGSPSPLPENVSLRQHWQVMNVFLICWSYTPPGADVTLTNNEADNQRLVQP